MLFSRNDVQYVEKRFIRCKISTSSHNLI